MSHDCMSKHLPVRDELLVHLKSHAERALQRVFPIQRVSWPRPTHFAAALVVSVEMQVQGDEGATKLTCKWSDHPSGILVLNVPAGGIVAFLTGLRPETIFRGCSG